MYIIEHFNMNLVNDQQHMLKANHVVECIIYLYLIPYTLRKKAFPLPPPGKEEDGRWVGPYNDQSNGDEYYTPAKFSKLLIKNYGNDLVGSYCIQYMQNELNSIRMQKSMNSGENDLLHLVDTITLTADPCDICQW